MKTADNNVHQRLEAVANSKAPTLNLASLEMTVLPEQLRKLTWL